MKLSSCINAKQIEFPNSPNVYWTNAVTTLLIYVVDIRSYLNEIPFKATMVAHMLMALMDKGGHLSGNCDVDEPSALI